MGKKKRNFYFIKDTVNFSLSIYHIYAKKYINVVTSKLKKCAKAMYHSALSVIQDNQNIFLQFVDNLLTASLNEIVAVICDLKNILYMS